MIKLLTNLTVALTIAALLCGFAAAQPEPPEEFPCNGSVTWQSGPSWTWHLTSPEYLNFKGTIRFRCTPEQEPAQKSDTCYFCVGYQLEHAASPTGTWSRYDGPYPHNDFLECRNIPYAWKDWGIDKKWFDNLVDGVPAGSWRVRYGWNSDSDCGDELEDVGDLDYDSTTDVFTK